MSESQACEPNKETISCHTVQTEAEARRESASSRRKVPNRRRKNLWGSDWYLARANESGASIQRRRRARMCLHRPDMSVRADIQLQDALEIPGVSCCWRNRMRTR